MGEGQYTDRELKTLLTATTFAIFLTPFMSMMLNLALVAIGKEFSVGSHSLGYVNTIFLLTSVIVMVPLTKVADLYGMKRTFVGGMLLLTVSSVLAAASPTFEIFLIARGAMGVGAAGISVTAISMIVNYFPPGKRGWAIGINTTGVYLGTALGPALGGFVTDLAGWRFLMLLIVPVTIVSLYAIAHFKVDPIHPDGKHLDVRGSILYGLMIFLVMFGVINLPKYWALAPIGVGTVFFALFIWYMKRAEEPIMDISIYKKKVFRRSIIATFMNYSASYSVSFFLALYLQNLGYLSASQAGLLMLLQPIVQVLLTARAGSLSDKIDKRILPTAGMGTISVAVAMILFMDVDVNFVYVGIVLLLLGLGFALFSAPNTSAAMQAVPSEDRNLASGSVSLMRQTGMMTSMGIAMCCISVILGSADNINPSTFGDFVLVMRSAFSVCLVMCIIGTAVSWFRGTDSSDCGQ
jgi:MFS family permease